MKLTQAKEALTLNHTNRVTQGNIARCKEAPKDFEKVRLEGHQIRARVKWRDKGDKMSS